MTDADYRTTDMGGYRLALLIDADNVSARIAPGLFAEIAAHGTIGVRRIYTDWTSNNAKGWKDCLALYAIQPVQQFAHVPGKNASDGAMIIDAMDLLHSQRFSGFCLVSSDSDFARLAIRIREQGVAVYGFGERHTPRHFVAACDRFVYLDTLRRTHPSHAAGKPGYIAGLPLARRLPARSVVHVKRSGESGLVPLTFPSTCGSGRLDDTVLTIVEDAVVAVADRQGRATLASVGTQILKEQPDFDSRHHGFAKLSDLAEACDFLEVERLGDIMQAITVRLRRRCAIPTSSSVTIADPAAQ